MTDSNLHCPLAENDIVTGVILDNASLLWTVKNYDYFEDRKIDIKSPSFSATTNRKLKWFVKLRPWVDYGGCKYYVDLQLYLSEKSEEKEVFAKSSFSVFDKNEKRFAFKSTGFIKYDIGHSSYWNCTQFCKIDTDFKKNILSNNSLRIHCEVVFPQKKDDYDHIHHCSALFPKSAMVKYDSTSVLDILLKTRLLSDVIISVKSKEFPAHKAILASQSKVFAAMFQHDTKEKELNRVDIEDMSEDVFGEVLQFIYTGRCGNLEEFAEELLAAADKYDLNGLKIICSEMLYTNLSVENAAQNLIVAEIYNATELKDEVIKFITARSAEVFDTVAWKNVSGHPQLLDQVCRAIARR